MRCYHFVSSSSKFEKKRRKSYTFGNPMKLSQRLRTNGWDRRILLLSIAAFACHLQNPDFNPQQCQHRKLPQVTDLDLSGCALGRGSTASVPPARVASPTHPAAFHSSASHRIPPLLEPAYPACLAMPPQSLGASSATTDGLARGA
jgi:hypothetical protein